MNSESSRPDQDQDEEIVDGFDLPLLIRTHGLASLKVAIAVAAVVLIGGAYYLWWGQPVVTTAKLQFRPTFSGVSLGRYPNGLPFGSGDVTDASVVNQVFDRNELQKYCARADFQRAFFVEQESAGQMFLDADYGTRLADLRISVIERNRLQAEYESKRASLPLSFSLVFMKPSSCSSLPTLLMTKSLSDVLSTWAEDAELKRGVLKLRMDILTPNVFDFSAGKDGSLLIKSDLLRSGLKRLATSIQKVEQAPGAELIRGGESKYTFHELRIRVDDLIQSGIEPLVSAAGRGLGPDSLVWVDEALAAALREQKIAEGKQAAYLTALREYSGQTTNAPTPRPEVRQPTTGSSDVQTLTPQIDRTFVDRIVELSAPNMLFRQELTRQMVDWSVEAVRQQGDVNHYQRLAEALRHPAVSGLTPREVEERLTAMTDQGRAIAKQFNDLYELWSSVSLREGAAMYHVEGPPDVDVLRSFTMRSYTLGVVGSFFAALLLGFAILVGLARFMPQKASA